MRGKSVRFSDLARAAGIPETYEPWTAKTRAEFHRRWPYVKVTPTKPSTRLASEVAAVNAALVGKSTSEAMAVLAAKKLPKKRKAKKK